MVHEAEYGEKFIFRFRRDLFIKEKFEDLLAVLTHRASGDIVGYLHDFIATMLKGPPPTTLIREYKARQMTFEG